MEAEAGFALPSVEGFAFAGEQPKFDGQRLVMSVYDYVHGMSDWSYDGDAKYTLLYGRPVR